METMKSNIAVLASKAVDIIGPQVVQTVVRSDGKTIWVNVDGICMLRVCGISKLLIEDQRKHHAERSQVFRNELGQGQKYAKDRIYSVVVKCDLNDAHHLADLFLDLFAMRSCLHYNGTTLSMCYSEAGSGAEQLKLRIESFTEGYFVGKEGK